MTAKELLTQVKQLRDALRCLVVGVKPPVSAYEGLLCAADTVNRKLDALDIDALLALLESCGNATPEQVRAALELADGIVEMTKGLATYEDQRIVRRFCEVVSAAYRAAVAQEGGEDK